MAILTLGVDGSQDAVVLARTLNCSGAGDELPCGRCAGCREVDGGILAVHEVVADATGAREALTAELQRFARMPAGYTKVITVRQPERLGTRIALLLERVTVWPCTAGNVAVVLLTDTPERLPIRLRCVDER